MAILKSFSLQNIEEFIAYPPEAGITYCLVEQVAQFTPDLLIHVGERQAAIQMMKLLK